MSNARNLSGVATGEFDVPAASLGNAVVKTGDTMTGNLIVNANVGFGTSSPLNRLTTRATANSYAGGNLSLESAGGANATYFAQTTPGDFYISNGGGADHIKLDSAGRVTMPYQPVFSARLSSNQTVNSGIAILQFASTDINQGSHFNTSTYRFTAPVAGKYYLNLRQYCNPASGTYMGVYITGTPGTRYGFSPVGNDTSVDVTWIVYLAAGDYVEGYYYNSGTMTARPDGTAFEGFLIG